MTRGTATPALKEWAAVISAIASGDQIILLRKGGIADSSFAIESPRFCLFPTYVHQKQKQFKASALHHFLSTDQGDSEPDVVDISVGAEVAATYLVRDLDTLCALEPFVIFTNSTIEERYRFRPDQAVHVVALRAFRLVSSAKIPNRREYLGCRSWIQIDERVPLMDSVPIVPSIELEQRIQEVDAVVARGTGS